MFRAITKQQGEATQVVLSHPCRACVAAAVAWSRGAEQRKAAVKQELHRLERHWYTDAWVFGSWSFDVLEVQSGTQLTFSQCGKAKLPFSSVHCWPERTEGPTYHM